MSDAPLAPWQIPLSRAQHRNRSLPNARYAQLATVRPDGHPANRTVVFRGMGEERDQLAFVTDARSQKYEHIHSCPWGELCWYFPKTREQFRIHGQLTLQSEGTQRQTWWNNLSTAAQAQFLWPTPGAPREFDAVFDDLETPLVSPPTHFCVLLLEPFTVDYLLLRGSPHNRYLYTRQTDGWTTQEVNP